MHNEWVPPDLEPVPDPRLLLAVEVILGTRERLYREYDQENLTWADVRKFGVLSWTGDDISFCVAHLRAGEYIQGDAAKVLIGELPGIKMVVQSAQGRELLGDTLAEMLGNQEEINLREVALEQTKDEALYTYYQEMKDDAREFTQLLVPMLEQGHPHLKQDLQDFLDAAQSSPEKIERFWTQPPLLRSVHSTQKGYVNSPCYALSIPGTQTEYLLDPGDDTQELTTFMLRHPQMVHFLMARSVVQRQLEYKRYLDEVFMKAAKGKDEFYSKAEVSINTLVQEHFVQLLIKYLECNPEFMFVQVRRDMDDTAAAQQKALPEWDRSQSRSEFCQFSVRLTEGDILNFEWQEPGYPADVTEERYSATAVVKIFPSTDGYGPKRIVAFARDPVENLTQHADINTTEIGTNELPEVQRIFELFRDFRVITKQELLCHETGAQATDAARKDAVRLTKCATLQEFFEALRRISSVYPSAEFFVPSNQLLPQEFAPRPLGATDLESSINSQTSPVVPRNGRFVLNNPRWN